MITRDRAWVRVSARVAGLVVAVALGAPVLAQQKDPKKLDKAQMQEAQALSEALDQAQSGQAAPSDFSLAIESYHFFKTANGQTYVPFTVTVDPKALANPAVGLMFRVVDKNAKPPAASPQKQPGIVGAGDRPVGEPGDFRDRPEAEKAKKAPLAPAIYQDLEFASLKPAEAGQPIRMSRAFQATGGDYDVYFALKERNPADKKQKAKIAVYKQTITVPEYNGTDIVTSAVLLADKVEPLQKPLAPEQQRENPYTIGQLQIVPKIGTKFAKTQELDVYFQIYNAALDPAKKPDVQVDFFFYQKQGETEKKIATSEPQILNASTLNPQFDPTKHQLVGGSAWPLTSFPVGDFRLEIKVTDKVAGKSLTRNVTFSVS